MWKWRNGTHCTDIHPHPPPQHKPWTVILHFSRTHVCSTTLAKQHTQLYSAGISERSLIPTNAVKAGLCYASTYSTGATSNNAQSSPPPPPPPLPSEVGSTNWSIAELEGWG